MTLLSDWLPHPTIPLGVLFRRIWVRCSPPPWPTRGSVDRAERHSSIVEDNLLMIPLGVCAERRRVRSAIVRRGAAVERMSTRSSVTCLQRNAANAELGCQPPARASPTRSRVGCSGCARSDPADAVDRSRLGIRDGAGTEAEASALAQPAAVVAGGQLGDVSASQAWKPPMRSVARSRPMARSWAAARLDW